VKSLRLSPWNRSIFTLSSIRARRRKLQNWGCAMLRNLPNSLQKRYPFPPRIVQLSR